MVSTVSVRSIRLHEACLRGSLAFAALCILSCRDQLPSPVHSLAAVGQCEGLSSVFEYSTERGETDGLVRAILAPDLFNVETRQACLNLPGVAAVRVDRVGGGSSSWSAWGPTGEVRLLREAPDGGAAFGAASVGTTQFTIAPLPNRAGLIIRRLTPPVDVETDTCGFCDRDDAASGLVCTVPGGEAVVTVGILLGYPGRYESAAGQLRDYAKDAFASLGVDLSFRLKEYTYDGEDTAPATLEALISGTHGFEDVRNDRCSNGDVAVFLTADTLGGKSCVYASKETAFVVSPIFITRPEPGEDEATFYNYRALAHELGHVFGAGHEPAVIDQACQVYNEGRAYGTSDSNSRSLMYHHNLRGEFFSNPTRARDAGFYDGPYDNECVIRVRAATLAKFKDHC